MAAAGRLRHRQRHFRLPWRIPPLTRRTASGHTNEHIPARIFDTLREGGSIVYPTSTLPGLGCLPNTGALDRLFALKRRPAHKVVSLGVASLDQAAELVHVPPDAAALLGAFPAGSLTLVMRARNPLDLRLGGEAVAIRVFDTPLAR